MSTRTSLNWELQRVSTAITMGTMAETMADSMAGPGLAGWVGGMGQIQHPPGANTLQTVFISHISTSS
jgi:hypothetical protein